MTFPLFTSLLCSEFQVDSWEATPHKGHQRQSHLGLRHHNYVTGILPSHECGPMRCRLVGRCQHILGDWSHHRAILGSLEMGTWHRGWPREGTQHRMGRNSSSQAWLAPTARHHQQGIDGQSQLSHPFGQLRQHRSSSSHQWWLLTKSEHKWHAKMNLFKSSMTPDNVKDAIHKHKGQHCGPPLMGRCGSLPCYSPACKTMGPSLTSRPIKPLNISVGVSFVGLNLAASNPPPCTLRSDLDIKMSPLRPPCPPNRRIFEWKGVHKPENHCLTSENSLISYLLECTSEHSLRYSSSYGCGLKKFHVFCNLFSVPEEERLPTSPAILKAFALWATTDPELIDASMPSIGAFETIATNTLYKYLAAIQAWNIMQGWPPPLSEVDAKLLSFSIHGISNIQAGSQRKLLCPPMTTAQLRALQLTLSLSKPFDTCL